MMLAAGVCESSAQGTQAVVTTIQRIGTNSVLILWNGTPGATYGIAVSSDLTNWDTVAYQIADASFGDFAFVDRLTAFFTAQFFAAALTNGDATFPNLTITNPTNDVVNDADLMLTGTASDDSGIREVRLNNVPISGTTNFSATVPLVPGTNRFLISAIDLSANRNRRSQIVQVQYVPVVPAILAQPVLQTNAVGETALFNVMATGSAPLSYQWRKNGVNLSDGARISGATTVSLAISNISAADVASYAVKVSNLSGSVTSSIATLTMTTPPGLIPVTSAIAGENFDSMGDAGTNTPVGWFVGTGTGAISGTNVTVNTGSATSGGNYNFGTNGGSDRALGSLAASSTQRDAEARFINASGSNIVSFAISYTGEQWRQGGASATNNDFVMQYSVTGTNFIAMGNQFNFNTPFDVGAAGALDGNATTNRVTGIGGTYTPSAAVTNAGIFYLRWADADNTSSDHGMAVDDLTVTFTFEAAP